MSLSIPTTTKPFRLKNRTASAPINPPAPVMMATLIQVPRIGSSRARCSTSQRWTSSSNRSSLRCGCQPVAVFTDAAVADVVGNVGWSRLGHLPDLQELAGEPLAPLRQLAQRDTSFGSTRDIVGRSGMAIELPQLQRKQIIEIIYMQDISDLQTFSAKARIGQRTAIEVPRHPQHDEALIDLAHLPRAGQNATAIDHGPQSVHFTVFFDQQFGGELGCAIQRTAARERKGFADAGRSRPAVAGRSGRQRQAIAASLAWKRPQSANRIDPARRKEQQVAAVAA